MIDIKDNDKVEKIINFWFEKDLDYKKWFSSKNTYDNIIKTNFLNILKEAESGYLHEWLCHPKSYLAMIILLDQFSRHIYRHTADAYKNDKLVLLFTEMGLDLHLDKFNAIEKTFVLMPYQHSENIEDQLLGIKILENLIANENNLEEKNILKRALYHNNGHLKILKKFNRFPKRNIYLNRESTEEEIDYIDETSDLPY